MHGNTERLSVVYVAQGALHGSSHLFKGNLRNRKANFHKALLLYFPLHHSHSGACPCGVWWAHASHALANPRRRGERLEKQKQENSRAERKIHLVTGEQENLWVCPRRRAAPARPSPLQPRTPERRAGGNDLARYKVARG